MKDIVDIVSANKKYIVEQIDEPDFGCEGRPEGKPLMDKVILQDEEGSRICIEAEDAMLYEKDIDEGSTVILSKDKTMTKI